MGNQWISLAGLFPGRTGNSVRNRCNLLLRRNGISPARDILPAIRPLQEKKPEVPCNIFKFCEPGTIYDHGTDDLLSFFFSGLEPENSSA
jgi:hypothetical protein